MATKLEKLASWSHFLEFLREERGDDPDSFEYNKVLHCEINSDAIVEDGLPLEIAILDPHGDVKLFDSISSAEQHMNSEFGGDYIDDFKVWYMDKEVELEGKIKILVG